MPIRDAHFCRKTPSEVGAEVYRKSFGVLDLGKSSGEDLAAQDVPLAWKYRLRTDGTRPAVSLSFEPAGIHAQGVTAS
jgi:hypothetical protein